MLRANIKKPARFFGLISFTIAIMLAYILWLQIGWDFFPSWITAITVVTFLTFGYDKFIAGSGRTRVPEKVLLALTFAGGTIGTILGRSLFRHKTVKQSFRARLWIVVGLQVIFIIIYLTWKESRLW